MLRTRRSAASFATASESAATAFASGARVEELERFHHDTESAALLAGLFVVPLIQAQTAFDQNRTALFQILSDDFGLFPEGIDINKRNFLFLLARFVAPRAIDRKADLGDSGAFGSVAQLRVARQVPGEDDFVEAWH